MEPVIITLIVLAIIGYGLYLILYRAQAKKINKRYDEKIMMQPWKADLFNTLRQLELRNEKKAEEPFRQYLVNLSQEELMYMLREKDDAKKD